MRAFVVDTSALVRLYVPDGPLPPGLEQAVELAWRAEALLSAPELALAEAAQVLRKKERAGYLTSAECDEVLDELLGLPIDFSGHRDLLGRAVEISRTREITVYDSLFIALAEKNGAELITADDRLLRRRTRAKPRTKPRR
jgi:predicted nucleic acid-binding protein